MSQIFPFNSASNLGFAGAPRTRDNCPPNNCLSCWIVHGPQNSCPNPAHHTVSQNGGRQNPCPCPHGRARDIDGGSTVSAPGAMVPYQTQGPNTRDFFDMWQGRGGPALAPQQPTIGASGLTRDSIYAQFRARMPLSDDATVVRFADQAIAELAKAEVEEMARTLGFPTTSGPRSSAPLPSASGVHAGYTILSGPQNSAPPMITERIEVPTWSHEITSQTQNWQQLIWVSLSNATLDALLPRGETRRTRYLNHIDFESTLIPNPVLTGGITPWFRVTCMVVQVADNAAWPASRHDLMVLQSPCPAAVFQNNDVGKKQLAFGNLDLVARNYKLAIGVELNNGNAAAQAVRLGTVDASVGAYIE